MLKINVEKHIKRIVLVLVSFLLTACDTSLTPNRWESDGYADLVFDMRLSRDTNGFYHLVLDRDNWQTLHRVSASVTENDEGVENFRYGNTDIVLDTTSENGTEGTELINDFLFR